MFPLVEGPGSGGNIPADRFIQHSEIDFHFRLLGNHRLGESRVAKPEASAGDADDETFWGMLVHHRLRVWYRSTEPGACSDVDIALLDHKARHPTGCAKRICERLQLKTAGSSHQQLVSLCVMEQQTFDRRGVIPGKSPSSRTRLGLG